MSKYQGLSYEERRAILESEREIAFERYSRYRNTTYSDEMERMFMAGFERGFDAALEQDK